MMTSAEIRRAFLDYFARNDHQIVESSPLVPANDRHCCSPMRAWSSSRTCSSAGTSALPSRRVVPALRARRRQAQRPRERRLHRRHHTFFEMLGNFSFGTTSSATHPLRLGIPDRTSACGGSPVVTVFHDDDEAADIWLRRSASTRAVLAPRRELELLVDGRHRPCGPCSEIFYDHGPESGRPLARRTRTVTAT